MSHTFNPPVDQEMRWTVDYFGNTPPDADPLALRMARYLAPGNRASNVYIMEDGSVTTNQPPSWNPADPTGPYAYSYTYIGGQGGTGVSTFTNPTSSQVRSVFYGGHANPCSDTDYSTLSAAGYGPPNLV